MGQIDNRSNLVSLSDDELIKMTQKGNMEAFSQLYQRFLPKVYSRVWYLVPFQDVEDVTQEIFIAVLRSIKNFKGKSKFDTWLRTITKRQIANFYRQRKRKFGGMDVNGDEFQKSQLSRGTTSVDYNSFEEIILLKQAIQNLPERYREVLLMRFAEGLKIKEIADAKGKSLEATKSLFRRSIQKLRMEYIESDA